MKKLKAFSLAITMSICFQGNAQQTKRESISEKITERPKIIYKSPTLIKPVLIIVDGKISNDSILSKFDPNIIQKIDVLKGEKAIVEYGNEGQNGVIIIKTKNKPGEEKTKTETN